MVLMSIREREGARREWRRMSVRGGVEVPLAWEEVPLASGPFVDAETG
jgi:hypothetical protein